MGKAIVIQPFLRQVAFSSLENLDGNYNQGACKWIDIYEKGLRMYIVRILSGSKQKVRISFRLKTGERMIEAEGMGVVVKSGGEKPTEKDLLWIRSCVKWNDILM